jgi:hypothetical protein
VAVPEQRQPERPSEGVQDGLVCDLASCCRPVFQIYDLRSTNATGLSAGGVADQWVTQSLRQGDARVFKKYSQMKLQMKREALQKLNRQANEQVKSFDTVRPN